MLNSTHTNALPSDAPWQIATAPDAARPGTRIKPQLPYRARLRGRLSEPAFAHCQDAARIFVVDAVVATYREKPADTPSQRPGPPAGDADRPRHHDTRFGYSLPHPPDWTFAGLDDASPPWLSRPWQ